MKRVFAHGGEAVVREVPEPTLRAGEVLVRPAYSAISVGTETWLIDGSADPDFGVHEYPSVPPYWPKTRTPVKLDHPMPNPSDPSYIGIGYSLAGVVVAVDDQVVDIAPGDLVACSGSQCAHHAELVSVPRNLVAKVPAGLSLDQAAFVTLGSISMAALRQTECHFGETVVQYGLGLLGLLGAQIGKAAGFKTIGIDINPARRRLATELGVDHVLDPTEDDVVDAVKEITDGYGADGVILGIKSESSEPLNLCFDMSRQRGRVVGLGVFGWNIDRGRFFANRVSLHPAVGYGPGRYDPVYEEGNVDYPIGLARWTENRNQEHFLDLMARGQVDVAPLAPDRVPIESAPEAYEILRGDKRPPTVLLEYGSGA
ncbi:MAG: zinc-binding alcohol dehydrogenase [Acidimicrobiia bacterium]|nr:zinc-binding alcohol dehydrogenase [Acidimicrobiia bacterium]MDH3462443.1 zinc-binding alcohol dehydrogenase [Acidimicrobiia bacterium]